MVDHRLQHVEVQGKQRYVALMSFEAVHTLLPAMAVLLQGAGPWDFVHAVNFVLLVHIESLVKPAGHNLVRQSGSFTYNAQVFQNSFHGPQGMLHGFDLVLFVASPTAFIEGSIFRHNFKGRIPAPAQLDELGILGCGVLHCVKPLAVKGEGNAVDPFGDQTGSVQGKFRPFVVLCNLARLGVQLLDSGISAFGFPLVGAQIEAMLTPLFPVGVQGQPNGLLRVARLREALISNVGPIVAFGIGLQFLSPGDFLRRCGSSHRDISRSNGSLSEGVTQVLIGHKPAPHETTGVVF